MVREGDIIKNGSPYQTGQFTGRTSEYATLKLLLTGVDDSAVVDTRVQTRETQANSAKLEVIDALIADLRNDLADVAPEKQLLEQYDRVGDTIGEVQAHLEQARSAADEAMNSRRQLAFSRGRKQDRVDEINDLNARFDLLSRHYQSDLLRLEAIRESGSIFSLLSSDVCPLCGTPPAEQRHQVGCDADTSAVSASAESEIAKIRLLHSELTDTRAALDKESESLIAEILEIDTRIKALTEHIDQLISPALTRTQLSFRELADVRAKVTRELDVYRRIERLEAQRKEIIEQDENGEAAPNAIVDLSKSVLDSLAQTVESLLKNWHFPAADRTYFDDSSRDFVIGGKPRGSFGKGFRAITHAASTLGLMEYCLRRDLPHPGFVVLDSPLLAYWEPEDATDSLIGTDLKERFFEYLSSECAKGQAIIIENEHPPESVVKKGAMIDFTRNPAEGRYGLFPIS